MAIPVVVRITQIVDEIHKLHDELRGMEATIIPESSDLVAAREYLTLSWARLGRVLESLGA